MKFNSIKLVFFLMLGLAGFSTGFVACSNGDYKATPDSVNNAPNPIYQPPPSNVHFTADIGSNKFTATTAYYVDTTVNNINLFEITGATNLTDVNNAQIIEIALTNYTGIGTYKLDANDNNVVFSYIPKGFSEEESADSGQLVITSIKDSVLTGTFQFTTDSGTVVTKGVFSNLPKQ